MPCQMSVTSGVSCASTHARSASASASAAAAAPAATPLAAARALVATGGLSTVLSQALHAGDDAGVELVLGYGDPTVVANTAAGLPVAHVAALLARLVGTLAARPARGAALLPWLRALIAAHCGYLLSLPDLADILHSHCKESLLVDAEAPPLPTARDRYMLYQPKSGAWVPIAEAAAADHVAVILKRVLQNIFHWQSFRESQLQVEEPAAEKPVIRPTSVQVQKMQNYYATAKNVRDVLRAMDRRLETSFARNPDHGHQLIFLNGVVDLRTGEFTGPAEPGLHITQWVPHPFPLNEAEGDAYWKQTIASFFPAACYPEHKEVERFFQKWCGLLLTEDMRVQKSLWVTGHGSNGKSVLSKVMAIAHGRRILHTLDIDALGVRSTQNNDSLYNARNARAVLIEENKENRQFDTKIFKKLVTGITLAWL